MSRYITFSSRINLLAQVSRYPVPRVVAPLWPSYSSSFASLVHAVCNFDTLRHGFYLHSRLEDPIGRFSNRRVGDV